MADLGIPPEAILDIRKGRYAVPSAEGRLTFVRLSERNNKRSFLQGYIFLQSQHSDELMDRAVFTPQGSLHAAYWSLERISDILLGIIVDPWGAAIRYGQELGQCCRCGKSLTDERSRWYGIGPECEQHWPEIIAEVDDVRGPYVGLEEVEQ